MRRVFRHSIKYNGHGVVAQFSDYVKNVLGRKVSISLCASVLFLTHSCSFLSHLLSL